MLLLTNKGQRAGHCPLFHVAIYKVWKLGY